MTMSAKYEVLKALVRAIDLKKRWDMPLEDLLENRRKANAKNKIPELRAPDMDVDRIEVDGCPVLTMKHKRGTNKANLFIIGGGMISAPRPGSVKKALGFAGETGLDLYVPYYPLCTEYPLTKAYEMIHATYKEIHLTFILRQVSNPLAESSMILNRVANHHQHVTRFLRCNKLFRLFQSSHLFLQACF